VEDCRYFTASRCERVKGLCHGVWCRFAKIGRSANRTDEDKSEANIQRFLAARHNLAWAETFGRG
jgi:hypothetical protein